MESELPTTTEYERDALPVAGSVRRREHRTIDTLPYLRGLPAVESPHAIPCAVGWRPLVATPNHPEYPAAHGSITSAVAEVLKVLLGSDQIEINIHGFDASGPAGNLNATRHFDTAAQLREEIVNARVWAGLHYRGSGEAGVVLGRRIAAYDLARAFRPMR